MPWNSSDFIKPGQREVSLENSLQTEIVRLTDEHWAAHVQDAAFAELIKGKEPGHRMADYVDDRTTALLKVNLDTRYEADRRGRLKKRSMGDVWVFSNEMFNPVNIKSGLQGMSGQPNLVAMQKLLDYLFKAWIDSYYLLIIKFSVDEAISHKAYLLDLLDWTDFITYDAGPGQIMLREKDFYDAFDSGYAPAERPIARKVETLFTRFEEGIHSLFTNRQERLERQRKLFKGFAEKPFVVNQSSMRFVP